MQPQNITRVSEEEKRQRFNELSLVLRGRGIDYHFGVSLARARELVGDLLPVGRMNLLAGLDSYPLKGARSTVSRKDILSFIQKRKPVLVMNGVVSEVEVEGGKKGKVHTTVTPCKATTYEDLENRLKGGPATTGSLNTPGRSSTGLAGRAPRR